MSGPRVMGSARRVRGLTKPNTRLSKQSVLVGELQFAQKLGLGSLNGLRDLYAPLGYKRDYSPTALYFPSTFTKGEELRPWRKIFPESSARLKPPVF